MQALDRFMYDAGVARVQVKFILNRNFNPTYLVFKRKTEDLRIWERIQDTRTVYELQIIDR